VTEISREHVTLAGHDGVLAGELAYPGQGDPGFSALVLGPHPYMGGTMENPLVVALTEGLAQAGGAALRFDFGGSGRSQGRPIDVAKSMAAFWATGRAPEDDARLADAEDALAWLAEVGPRPRFVVGYSFGAAAAWRLALRRRSEIDGLALLSPTLTRHAFPAPDTAETPPTLVVHSARDFCTPGDVLVEWAERQGPAVHVVWHDDDHFFRGAEAAVAREVAEFLTGSGAAAPRERTRRC